MNTKRILVPYDFSEFSVAALDYAACFAGPGSRLYIVHVDELLDVHISALPPPNGPYVVDSSWATRRRKVRLQLSKIVPHAPVPVYEHHCVTGFPADEILSFAEQIHTDLIVMGSHGRTGVTRLIVGSVAEQVMRRSKCPVLIVKPPVGRYKTAVAVESESAALRVGNGYAI
jgi:nucleotide-binding universal stress UspA family protein